MLKAWFNPFHIAAGFIAVLVGYTSSAVIIFQAAAAAGASPDQISSWLWALGIGMALCGCEFEPVESLLKRLCHTMAVEEIKAEIELGIGLALLGCQFEPVQSLLK